MNPNGQPKSATNRSVVLVCPAVYDLGTDQLTLNTEFVDLVGLSTARDDQYIFGTSNGVGTGYSVRRPTMFESTIWWSSARARAAALPQPAAVRQRTSPIRVRPTREWQLRIQG